MQIRTLRDDVELAEWTERWDRLGHQAGALVFSAPGWVAAWRRVMEPDASIQLLIDGPDDNPVGLFALSELRQRLHPRIPASVPYLGIAGSGLGSADHLGPITESAESGERLLIAASAMAERRPLVLAHLGPAHADAARNLPGSTAVTTTPVPGIDLTGVNEPEALWSTKMGKNLRRVERRMVDRGFTRSWTRIGGETSELLGEHGRLHAKRWQALGRSGLFDDRRRRFLTAVATELREPDGLWIQLINGSSGNIGSALVFRYGRTVCTYSTGRDPEFHELNLGPLLHSAAIRWAVEGRATRYEFLRGVEQHKARLGGSPSLDTSFVVGTSPTARILRVREAFLIRRDERAKIAQSQDDSGQNGGNE